MNNITEQEVLARLENESTDIKSSNSHRSLKKNICDNCDKKQTILGVEYCGECKCILLFKTSFKYARCPLNKWEVEIPPFANKA
jgi:hypothetical protein